MSSKDEEEKLLNMYYDYVLDPSISRDERKIGLMAKKDLENSRYTMAVINQTMTSLRFLALRDHGLTTVASGFYEKLNDDIIKNKPFGTNLGYMGANASYLDN